jgi:hypothetical protein
VSRQRAEHVGPLIPGAWSRHDDELGREARGEFLLDTGAYGAMIDLDVAESLQLRLQGSREVHGIHGYGRLQQFLGRVFLANRRYSPRWSSASPCLRSARRIANMASRSSAFLGGCFLHGARLTIDGISGRVEIEISGDGD